MTGPTGYAAEHVLVSAHEPPRVDSAVLVDGERIVAVVGRAEIPANLATVDIGQSWLLPGLIATHVHLAWDGGASPDRTLAADPPELTALRAARHAEEHLRAGITTVRDCGAPRAIVLAVRDAIEQGIATGSRVLAAGELISRSGENGMSVLVDGPDQTHHVVAGLAAAGADLVKVRATECVFGLSEDLDRPKLRPPEEAAAIAEAHRHGLGVAAHAYSARGVRNAIEAGVDTLEHASFLDADGAALAAAGGQTLVPALVAYQRYTEPGADQPADSVCKARGGLAAGFEAVAHARRHRVPIAAGSDAGGRAKPHGCLAHELALLVDAGLTPAEALAAATTTAAAALGRADLGALTSGSRADIIGVTADPTHDVRSLLDVHTVVAAGRAVRLGGSR
jgi:imidazolonepropionase-like amidohydrolase